MKFKFIFGCLVIAVIVLFSILMNRYIHEKKDQIRVYNQWREQIKIASLILNQSHMDEGKTYVHDAYSIFSTGRGMIFASNIFTPSSINGAMSNLCFELDKEFSHVYKDYDRSKYDLMKYQLHLVEKRLPENIKSLKQLNEKAIYTLIFDLQKHYKY